MTAAGQAIYLPVLSPARSALRDYTPRRHFYSAQNQRQARVYRLPPRERQGNLTYCSNGYAMHEQVNGTIIDLYA